MEIPQRRSLPEDRPAVAPARLTTQELIVYRNCQIEGFYRCSLPLATVLATAAYVGCHKGYLKKNPKWGATGKMTAGIFVGYLAGKFLYLRTCYQRLLNVPGGAFAAHVKNLQGNKELQDPGFTSLGSLDAFTLTSQTTDSAPSSLDLDLESVPVSEPEFTRQFADDFSYQENKLNEPLLYSPPVTTYEELRKRNRDQYESQRNVPPQNSPRQYQPPSSSVLLEPEERVARRRKNQYGDDMDNFK